MKDFFCFLVVVGLAAFFGVSVGFAVPDRQPPHQTTPPKYFTNSIGMKFVWIPPGAFIMGSPKEEAQRRHNEIQRKVTLTRGFYLGIHLVTQEQWQAVTGNNPSYFKGEKNLPVEEVSWNDCKAFCEKLRAKERRPYRLPTDAEFEYACRAGTTPVFHFGDEISTDRANYHGMFAYGNGKPGLNRKKTTPVGSFPPNAWGLYDMHGNLWQWCEDWYEDNPQQAVDPQGPNKGEYRVMRGSAWSGDPQYCRSACRTCGDGRGTAFFGFRVCFFRE